MDAITIIEDAIRTFKSNISDIDAKEIGELSVQDVINSARNIEREREERRNLCNLRRVEFLLEKLQKLADAVCKLTQSSCPQHFIWGPVKLALEIADEDDEALEAILGGYARLTSGLRFLDLVAAIPQLVIAFQEVIAHTLSDVLDFHGRVYQALRRGGWQMLFNVSWAELTPVFDCTIRRLEQSCSLVNRAGTARSHVFEEVNITGNATAQLGDRFFDIQNAIFAPPEDFSAAREFREKVLEDLQAKQKRRADHQLLECIEWLDLGSQDRDQASRFTHCRDVREETTCEWILSHPKVKSWLDPDSRKAFLWLKGKPGSGKTTLATYIIEHAKLPSGSVILYYLCPHENQPSQGVLNALLSVLVAQILRSKRHLVPYVFETYVKNAEQPALKLHVLLRQLLSCLPSTYIVVDGLNECDSETQGRIINKLDAIIANPRNGNTAGPETRILIISQEVKSVPHKLSKQPSISLTEEHLSVSRDIKTYTMNAISSLEDRFHETVVEEIASEIIAKANGMFLWVKLILLTLLEQGSLFEVRATLDQLPTGLAGIYKILLRRLENVADSRQKPRIRMIFYWMLFALRPVKLWEICDALVIGGSGLILDKNTMLHSGVMDICKPLIEVHQDQTISFVHFSVKDYLLCIDSGPFISRRDALTHITSTCLKYLFTCENFFSAQCSIETYRQIASQAHNLFPYVAETWKSHFTALATDLSTPPDKSESLLSSLLSDNTNKKTFLEKSTHCQQNLQPEAPQTPAQIRTDRDTVRRCILQDLRDAFISTEKDEYSMSPNEGGRDSVKQAFTCFQVQFEQLLMNQCPYSPSELSLSQSDLDIFRGRHATTAFLCRWGRCQYSIQGFSNVEERVRHERSHGKQFCCPELECDFSANGFTSRAALRNHIHKYHKIQQDTTVPKLVIGRGEASKGNQTQLRRCCMCQKTSQTVFQTRCGFGDCIHEYCSNCSRTTVQPRSFNGHASVSTNMNKLSPNSAEASHLFQTAEHQAQPQMSETPLLSSTAAAHRRRDGNPADTGVTYYGDDTDDWFPFELPEPTSPPTMLSSPRQHAGDLDELWSSPEIADSPDDYSLRLTKRQSQPPQAQHHPSAADSPTVSQTETLDLFHSLYLSYKVSCIAFSPNGMHLATSPGDRVNVFNLELGQYLDDYRTESFVRCLCYSPNGTRLAAGVSDGRIYVWNTKTRVLEYSFQTNSGGIPSLVFVLGDEFIATVSESFESESVNVWEIASGVMIRTLRAQERGLTSIAMSSDGQYIAAGSSFGVGMFLWDYASGLPIARHIDGLNHTSTVHGVVFSPKNDRLASCSNDGIIKIWEIGPQYRKIATSGILQHRCLRTLKGHEDSVTSICFARNGNWIISGSLDKSVRFWDLEATDPFVAVEYHGGYVTCVAYSQTTDLFASGSDDQRVRIWRCGAHSNKAAQPSLLATVSASSHHQGPAPTIPFNGSSAKQRYIIKCVCGSGGSYGNEISCERCGTWQHAKCYPFSLPPNRHLCMDCVFMKPFQGVSAGKAAMVRDLLH